MTIKRSNRSDLYNNIIDCLKKEALSISDISKKTDINWETAKRTLEILNQIGVLGEKEDKNKRVFFIKDKTILDEEKDTLLGLPLNESQRETTKSLFKKIKKMWYKNTDRPLNKTFMQKIAVKIIKETKLENVPYGWYLFGKMAVLQCNPSQEIIVNKDYLGNSYDNKIKEIVLKYQKFRNTEDLMTAQYMEEGNELYSIKLRLNKDFLNIIDSKDIPLIKKKIIGLVFNLKKTEDNERIIELASGFVSIVGQLLNKLNIKELEDVRFNILDSFKALWECIATYNLYISLLENKFYERELLNKYYLLKITPLLEICESYLSFLNDLIPKEKPIEDELSKFKGALGG